MTGRLANRVMVGALASALSTFSAQALGRESIPLTNDYALVIDTNALNPTVEVSLSWLGQKTISVRVSNAGFTSEGIQHVKLCSDCPEVYFVPIWDASSTYGALTGIIAWPSERWWNLSILPLSTPAVEDPNADGVFDLVDNTISDGQVVKVPYTFRNGLIAKSR